MKKANPLILTAAAMLAVVNLSPAQATFTKITTGPVVTDLGEFTRPVWGDFNNDGWLDLFVSGFDDKVNVFYLNNGNGTFTKRTVGEPVLDVDFHSGCALGDYDNDGKLDLLVSAGVIASNARRNKLYHNIGNGTFERVSGGTITNQLGYFNACAWADYDNDGFLDLVVTDGSEVRTGRAFLFHNRGDGSFDRITTGTVPTDVNSGNAVWADYDGDGYMDLLVLNDANDRHCLLYHNDRNGTFTRITTSVIATDLWPSGIGCGAWGDYDNDGLLDLFVTGGTGTTNRLYHNSGNGIFTSVNVGPMLQTDGGTCVWGDYDNDGYLDLFVANYNGPNRLFHNNGDGTFTAIDSEPLLNELYCMSPTLVDYDNDGFLDLFLTRALFDGTLVSNSLYHNNGNTNNWVEVKLVGTVANRSGIGAKVRVKASINGKTFWQLREINNGGGWNIQTLVAHFGLGNATNIETLRIEWPSGTVQEIQNVAAKHLTVTEPSRLVPGLSNGVPQFTLQGGRNLQYDIQTSTNLADWSLLTTLTITNVNGTALIADTNAPALDRRFYRAVLH